MKSFVDYKWLMENINKKNLIILDARAALGDPLKGLNSYKNGHIKGAQFVDLEETMTGKVSSHGGRHPFPNIEKFVEDMKKLGVCEESTVLVYDDGSLEMASRLWYLLKYIGKNNVFILEGGIYNWERNNGEITTLIPEVNKSDFLPLNLNSDMIVDVDYVKNAINNDNIAIVDARSNERYIGKVEPIDKIAGHIPSALNYPWTNLVQDKKIVSLDELEKFFKELHNYDEIIVHCGSGITAIVDILLMNEIGLKARLYAGSYSDWISYTGNVIIQNDVYITL